MSSELQLDKSDWTPVTLGDVVAEVRTTTKYPVADGIERVIGLEHIESECIHLRNWASIEEKTTFTKVFRKGHVLFGRRRAYLKKAAIATFDGICSGDITVLKAKSGLLPELLPFLINNDKFFDYAVQHSAGGLSPRSKFKDIANYEFLLPTKDQQAQLAELLWAANSEVQKLSTAEEAARKFRDSTFKSFREKFNKKHSKKVANLLVDGPTNGYSPKTSEHGASYTVSIGAVKDGHFTPEGNLKKATVDQSTLEKFNVIKNDVFVVRGNGNRLLCARAGLATETQENLFYPDLLIRLRFDHEQIVPEFAAYQWNHPSAHYRLLQRAKSTNGISKINGDDIKNHTLIVPPISKQKEILNEIGKIEKRVKALGEAKTNAIRLEKSLINQIF